MECDTAITFNVLANDTDTESDTLRRPSLGGGRCVTGGPVRRCAGKRGR